jgi:hypothetical protein
VAFPVLPTWPARPATVDPDRGRSDVHGHACARRVQPTGTVEVDRRSSSSTQPRAGPPGVLLVQEPERVCAVLLGTYQLTTLPIQGRVGQERPVAASASRMREETRAEDWRRPHHQGWRPGQMWAN